MAIAFITGNEKKFREVSTEIPGLTQLRIDLPEIQELDSKRIIEEKFRVAQERHKGDLLVDDVGLHLECLGGFPGPLIKWYLQSLGPQGIWRVCDALGDDRARATCTLGFSHQGKIMFFEGAVAGRIIKPREGTEFGFDPIFLPDGHEKTFGEMTTAEKNSISHRGIAVKKLKEFLERQA